jgi:hypothetical protein
MLSWRDGYNVTIGRRKNGANRARTSSFLVSDDSVRGARGQVKPGKRPSVSLVPLVQVPQGATDRAVLREGPVL